MQSVKVEFSTLVEGDEIRAVARRLLTSVVISYFENPDGDCWDVKVAGIARDGLRGTGEFYLAEFDDFAIHGLSTVTVDGREVSSF